MYSRYYKLMIVVLRFMYSYQHTVLFIGNYQYVAIIGISLCMYYVLIWTELYCIIIYTVLVPQKERWRMTDTLAVG